MTRARSAPPKKRREGSGVEAQAKLGYFMGASRRPAAAFPLHDPNPFPLVPHRENGK